MADYPGAITSFPTLIDDATAWAAGHHNNAANEIVAIETELGINPKGDFADLKSRIAAVESAPVGYLINGKIVVSVATNNLTVAMKTLAGNDPSATDPVRVNINGTMRTITSALSVTLPAGTNWCNAGSSVLAAQAVNYFIYIGYNATDGVTLGPARIPYGMTYADFSGTSTDEKHIALSNAAHASGTDDYVNIGRFTATLSSGAGYTWSISGSGAIINRPIFSTDWLTFNLVFINLTIGNGTTNVARYRISEKKIEWYMKFTLGTTSSISGSISFSIPMSANSNYPLVMSPVGYSRLHDTGTVGYAGSIDIDTSSNNCRFLVHYVTATTYASLALTSATVPHTWASTDWISCYGSVEVA